MRIGVDIMGGDFMPQAPVEGAARAYKRIAPDHELVLIGDRTLIGKELEKYGLSPDQMEIVHTESFIGMEESPTKAIAAKRDSSINLGIGMLRDHKIDGFVSAGNTGAMLVASIFGLGTIEGVSRPTIGVIYPNNIDSYSLLCDIGANVDCKAETLRQFGVLGSVYMKSVQKISNPRIALVNLGEEEKKGPQIVQAAHQLMKEEDRINFIGNMEGRDIYSGKADVFICDGFIGNVLLKFGESLYEVLKSQAKKEVFMERFNFENYGGVPILGVKGISIIGHGISTPTAVENMIYKAIDAVDSGLVQKIEAAFQAAPEN